MGRTNPTYRDRLSNLEQEWSEYRRALRTADQPHFDQLFEHGRTYAHAAGYHNHPNPEILLLVSVLLAHQRELATLNERIDALTERGGDLDERLEMLEEPTENDVQD